MTERFGPIAALRDGQHSDKSRNLKRLLNWGDSNRAPGLENNGRGEGNRTLVVSMGRFAKLSHKAWQ